MLHPWQFSPIVVAALGCAAVCYGRGSSRTSAPVPVPRRTALHAVAFFIVLGRNLEREEAALTARQLVDHSW